MKRRKTHRRELLDCRKCVWNLFFFYSPPFKAFVEIIYDKKTRQNFDYPY